MPENHPQPVPFDPSRYSPEELDDARCVIHSLYRSDRDRAEGAFEPSRYSPDELTFVAEVVAALRKGPAKPPALRIARELPEGASASEGRAVEWRRGGPGGEARLVLTRDGVTQHPSGAAETFYEVVRPLTDWLSCPRPPNPQRDHRAIPGGEGGEP